MTRLGVVSKDRYEAERARADTLADAIHDILALATGWSRPMPDAKRLAFIEQIGTQAFRCVAVSRREARMSGRWQRWTRRSWPQFLMACVLMLVAIEAVILGLIR